MDCLLISGKTAKLKSLKNLCEYDITPYFQQNPPFNVMTGSFTNITFYFWNSLRLNFKDQLKKGFLIYVRLCVCVSIVRWWVFWTRSMLACFLGSYFHADMYECMCILLRLLISPCGNQPAEKIILLFHFSNLYA